MKYHSNFGKKLEHLCSSYLPTKPFLAQLCYFLLFSLMGFLCLKVSKPKTDSNPNDIDLFFTSVSAITISSMLTVEMEVFSNVQLIIMTIFMLLGGEVFTTMLGLQLRHSKFPSLLYKKQDNSYKANSLHNNHRTSLTTIEQIELGKITTLQENPLTDNISFIDDQDDEEILNHNSIKSLGCVVLGYLLVTHIVGSSLLTLYISLTPSARNMLKTKGLVLPTFSIFTIVSNFSNCGFTPTNENMMAFRANPGLLLILIPQILLGNTLYPPCLRLVLWVLERFTKRREYTYILKNHEKLGYDHLMSSKRSWFLFGTTLVFLMVQLVLFCIMEWSSGAMEGMNSYEKLVGSLFQVTNSRHTGESIVDLSIVSSAILVMFVVMMYLPPYTSFLPIGYDRQQKKLHQNEKREKRSTIIENLLFSQLSYLAIFVIVICITERNKLKEDPLNFNILNIVIEVISAYGNVGFSMGYSCKRRLIKLAEKCEDKWYGFAGRWSKAGKLVLIAVMFFGRLKKFNMHGGKAWKLS